MNNSTTKTPALHQSVTKGHWAILAGARFFLAFIVMARHTALFLPPDMRDYCRPFPAFGAMVAFLTISGFSIAASLDKAPAEFYLRRVVRIFPAYFATLAICLLPWAIQGWQAFTLPQGGRYAPPKFMDLLVVGVLAQGLLPFSVASFRVSWTLSLEVLYYLFGPIIKRLPTLALAAFCALSWIAYVTHYKTMWSPWNWLYLGGAWVIGVAAYRHRGPLSFAVVLAYGCSMLALHDPVDGQYPYAAWIYGIAIAALFYGHIMPAPKWSHKALNFLGDASYPLYLVHWGALMILALLLPASLATAPLFLWVAVIGLSALVTAVIDRPVREWLGRKLKLHTR